MYKITNLNNGVRIISHKMQSAKSVSVGVWVKTGSRNESSDISGISHFLEHMVFKGTKKYDTNQLKEAIEGVGGTFNAFTSIEYTCFFVRVVGKYLGLSLDVLSNMVLYPLVTKSAVDTERGVILEEIKLYNDQPIHLVHDILEDILWPSQALGRPIIGNEKTVSSIDRNALLEYREKYYSGENITIVACGNVDHQGLVKKVKSLFGKVARGQKSTVENAIVHTGPKVNVHCKKTEQTRIAIGFHAYSKNDDYRFANSILHVILGGNMSSRLFNELREKRGLAYDIASSFKRYSDTGLFYIDAGVDKKNVVDSLKLIHKQLETIKNNLVTQDEIKRAREYYIGQFSLMLEETLDHMIWIAEEFLELGQTKSPESVIKKIKTVTREDVKRVSEKLFNKNNFHLAVVGPVDDKQKKEIEAMFE